MVSIVNAWIHFKLVNQELCTRSSSRYNFIDRLASQFIDTRWQEKESDSTEDERDMVFRSLCAKMAGDTSVNDDDSTCFDSVFGNEDQIGPFGTQCIPKSVKELLGKNRCKRKAIGCQICSFEGRSQGIVGNVVICMKHRIRCCTQGRDDVNLKKKDLSDVTDYSWRAPKSAGVTCWDKAHNFYIPQQLFMDNVGPMKEDDITSGNLKDLKFPCIRVSSELNKKKKEALGFTSKPRAKKQKLTATTRHEPNASRKEPDDDDIGGLGPLGCV